MKTLTLLSGAAMLAVAGVALAQAGSSPEGAAPQGDVTRQQALARADEMFARLDANHDGRVTPEEARTVRMQRREEMRQHLFDRFDANHDGNINREEFAQAHAMRDGPHRQGRRHGGHMGPPPGGPGDAEAPAGPEGAGGHGMRGRGMFGTQGFITLEQMRARAAERFDRADANHDGTLTSAERQAAHGGMRRGRHHPRPN